MLTSLGVSESFGKTEINHIDVVLLLSNADEEIVWLNVPMKEVTGVNKLNPLKLEVLTVSRNLTI